MLLFACVLDLLLVPEIRADRQPGGPFCCPVVGLAPQGPRPLVIGLFIAEAGVQVSPDPLKECAAQAVDPDDVLEIEGDTRAFGVYDHPALFFPLVECALIPAAGHGFHIEHIDALDEIDLQPFDLQGPHVIGLVFQPPAIQFFYLPRDPVPVVQDDDVGPLGTQSRQAPEAIEQ
jgi:hypothetical protein